MVTSGEIQVEEMADAATTGVVASVKLPSNSDLTTNPQIIFSLVTTVTGVAGDVRFEATLRYVADGELTTKAADETILLTNTAINTADAMDSITFTLNGSLMAAGDFAFINLRRLGLDAADTFTGRVAVAKTAIVEVDT